MLALSENKHKSISINFGAPIFHDVLAQCIIHNSTSTAAPTVTQIVQGDTNETRNGMEIYTVGIRIRGVFKIPYDRRNVAVKIWWVEHNSAQGDPSVYDEFFENITGDGMLDKVEKDRFNAKLLMNKRLRARDLIATAGIDASMYYNFWIPFKRKLTFRNGANLPVKGLKEYISLICLAYDTTTSAVTDHVITDNEQLVTLYFKDP